jgi:hypothetical protein
MSLENYVSDKMWTTLVEAVHELVMFTRHKAYTRDSVLPERPDVPPEELAVRLGIPFGEALVILFELKTEKRVPP